MAISAQEAAKRLADIKEQLRLAQDKAKHPNNVVDKGVIESLLKLENRYDKLIRKEESPKSTGVGKGWQQRKVAQAEESLKSAQEAEKQRSLGLKTRKDKIKEFFVGTDEKRQVEQRFTPEQLTVLQQLLESSSPQYQQLMALSTERAQQNPLEALFGKDAAGIMAGMAPSALMGMMSAPSSQFGLEQQNNYAPLLASLLGGLGGLALSKNRPFVNEKASSLGNALSSGLSSARQGFGNVGNFVQQQAVPQVQGGFNSIMGKLQSMLGR